ncbi:hypothetical protein K3495_g5806 [Podosphaera aphanis]|nr:hypothetical protein K3495_g5806 [Podosphaera aphanis]
MLRLVQQTATRARFQSLRSPLQKRLSSTQTPRFIGAEDNAFNRERLAVKQHAAATSVINLCNYSGFDHRKCQRLGFVGGALGAF